MNTNLIMGLLIQLVAALKEPTPPASGSYSNLIGWSPPFTNTWQPTLYGRKELTGWDARTNVSLMVSDEAVRALAKSGRICEVLGHRWEGGRVPGTSFRHYSICGAGQSKTEGDWK